MTLTLELAPDVEAALDAAARQNGRSREELAAEVLRQAYLVGPGKDADDAQIAADLQASEADFAAGRWLSLEDVQARVAAEWQARQAQKPTS